MLKVNFQPTHYSVSDVDRLLRHLEWDDVSADGSEVAYYVCFNCRRPKEQGHHPECLLKWILDQTGKEIVAKSHGGWAHLANEGQHSGIYSCDGKDWYFQDPRQPEFSFGPYSEMVDEGGKPNTLSSGQTPARKDLERLMYEGQEPGKPRVPTKIFCYREPRMKYQVFVHECIWPACPQTPLSEPGTTCPHWKGCRKDAQDA